MFKTIAILSFMAISGLGKPVIDTPRNLYSPAPSNWAYRFGMWNPESPTTDLYLVNSSFDHNIGAESTFKQFFFTRSAVGEYYTYISNTTSDVGTLTTPFTIDMEFHRSNTGWDNVELGTTDWFIYDTKVGSNASVGTTIDKWSITISNITKRDYMIAIDNDSTNDFFVIEYNIDTNLNQPTTITDYGRVIELYDDVLNYFMIPAYTIVNLRSSSTSLARYLDSYYIFDMGESSAWYNGYTSGNAVGYSNGYSAGYDSAYDADAYSQGYDDGASESFTGNFHTWIVPAIIVVLFLGAVSTIWAYKRKQE